MQADYLIIGQGLCGTWLSYYLMRAGATVLVIDGGTELSASAAASGIINPITGKRLARQWMGDIMLPFARQAYETMGAVLQEALITTIDIHTFFSNAAEAALFELKSQVIEDLLHYDTRTEADEIFNHHYGTGTISPAMLVDVRRLLAGWRRVLKERRALLEEHFDWENGMLTEGGVRYRDITAKAVIDCTGATSAAHPYFDRLPFALNKGEAIIASIPGLPRTAVYKYAQLSIVPWEADRFWIGSTYDWDFTDRLPTEAFRQKADAVLEQWLRLPYELEAHFAAIRPATVTRDAFAGMHPQHPQVGILNGMGSKGCSLAPFLAHNLAEHLIMETPLISQVDVGRYARVLAR